MEFIQSDSGLLFPKPKPEPPKKPERPTSWDCPSCGEFFDLEKAGEVWEATVGSIGPGAIPHISCPHCEKCMGCTAN